ncbi:MAG: histidine kinase [Cyclobacteriaceae bacterium]|nr:histidine kinase [Cyclobacteriaceae bacterium]
MSRFFSYRLDHITFWILTVFFHGYTRLSWINKAGISQFILELVIRNGLLACAIYITILFAIPRLTKGKHVVGVLGIIFAMLIYVVGKNAHDVYFYGYVVGDPERQHFFYNTFYNLSIVIFYLAFATTLYLSRQWYLQREKLRQIEMEKLNTELEYLRAQINPHFLFNSINTIYFQIDKQNTAARETLEKFSEMLRYQLYECTGTSIALEKEIQYLQNYITLQKLRLSNRYNVELETDAALKELFIPPLVLIPFVENAFKHVSHFTDKPNKTRFTLAKTGNSLQFTSENTIDSFSKKETGGIGLKNVTRRLDLLYGERYELEIKSEGEMFRITLQIPFL